QRFDLELAGPVGYDETLAFRGTRSVPVRRRPRPAATAGAGAAVAAGESASAAGPVVVDREDAVLVVTLTRPAGDNRLDRATLTALGDVLTTLPDDVAAIVLRAEGRHFCIGGDLDELAEIATT